jgi:hypothetical protein
MGQNWTADLDGVLVKMVLHENRTYVDAARVIGEMTGGAFAPHPVTCLRRMRALLRTAKTGGRARVRSNAPTPSKGLTASRGACEYVAAFPLEMVERVGLDALIAAHHYALAPNWVLEIAKGRATDALASAQHRAALNGEMIVAEDDGNEDSVTVHVRRAGGASIRASRSLVLVVLALRDNRP